MHRLEIPDSGTRLVGVNCRGLNADSEVFPLFTSEAMFMHMPSNPAFITTRDMKSGYSAGHGCRSG